MAMIKMLPFAKTEKDVENNRMAVESMLEQNERYRKSEEERWENLTSEQKQAEKEAPALELGFKKCPRCGMIPQVWRSLAEGYGLEPFVWCFDEPSRIKAEKGVALGLCKDHTEKQGRDEIWAARFKTLEEAREFWNRLIEPNA